MDPRTWIVLADAATARIFQWDGHEGNWTTVEELEHPESRAKTSDLVSDKPGRVKQSRGYRSAMEPPTPRKKVEAQRFARQIADELDGGLVKRRAYERLVLVAPPSFLGLLRRELSERVQRRIVATIEKDYLHLEMPKLRERLREQLDGR